MNDLTYIDILQYDCHMHSSFSEDSDTPMENMVKKAVDLGLAGICFTEHVDYDWPKDQGTFLVDHDAFFSEVSRLRAVYSDRLDILAGAELGMQKHVESQCFTLAGAYPFDFLIASQHLLSGKDPYLTSFWTGRDITDTLYDYFTSLYENLQQMREYDTLGHLDYICRYIPDHTYVYDWHRFSEIIDQILLHLIRHDKCLEINASGLRKGSQANPCEGILSRYHQLGGRHITIGSDAHTCEDIAKPYDQLFDLLHRCGFDSICTFRFDPTTKKRIRSEHSL